MRCFCCIIHPSR